MNTGAIPVAAVLTASVLAASVLAASVLVGPGPASANVLAERRQRFEPVGSSGGIVAAEQREAMAVGAAATRWMRPWPPLSPRR
jgi:hypothetical protein